MAFSAARAARAAAMAGGGGGGTPGTYVERVPPPPPAVVVVVVVAVVPPNKKRSLERVEANAPRRAFSTVAAKAGVAFRGKGGGGGGGGAAVQRAEEDWCNCVTPPSLPLPPGGTGTPSPSTLARRSANRRATSPSRSDLLCPVEAGRVGGSGGKAMVEAEEREVGGAAGAAALKGRVCSGFCGPPACTECVLLLLLLLLLLVVCTREASPG